MAWQQEVSSSISIRRGLETFPKIEINQKDHDFRKTVYSFYLTWFMSKEKTEYLCVRSINQDWLVSILNSQVCICLKDGHIVPLNADYQSLGVVLSQIHLFPTIWRRKSGLGPFSTLPEKPGNVEGLGINQQTYQGRPINITNNIQVLELHRQFQSHLYQTQQYDSQDHN